jgi:UPF0271 protein
VFIDLNADVGESFGAWQLGEDERLIPLVSSVNVACGFHAGDPLTIERTVRIAAAAGVSVGAHPGYPDLAGFGRRAMNIPPDELEALIVYQVGAVATFARAAGTEIRHVKPHGALYNRAADDAALAETIARGVRRVSPDLALVGLAGSVMLDAGRAAGLRVCAEAFADRVYEANGRLRSRDLQDALIDEPAEAARQAVAIALDHEVNAIGGSVLDVEADTLCVHGDAPGAADRAAAVRWALEAAGVEIRAPE